MPDDPSSFGFAASGASAATRRGRPVEIRLDTMFDQPPPQAPEAEAALLGAMILEPGVISDVIGAVPNGTAFYSERHGAIFDAMTDLHDRHASGDLVQLADNLRDRGVLEDVGGPNYLAKLAQETPGAAGAMHWARIVSEKARLRSLIDTAGQIVYDAYTRGQSESGADEILDEAEQRIFDIARRTRSSEAEILSEVLQATYLELEKLNELGGRAGVPSGFHDLDELLVGLQTGDMIILAARPSMGKTTFALNVAEQIALPKRGESAVGGVAFFSMEMSKASVAQRLLSAYSGVPTQKMRKADKLTHDDFTGLMSACEALGEAELFIDDTPGLTVMGLRARARRLVAQHKVKAIVVDYLQLMTSPAHAKQGRQVEVAAISRGIKALARELETPIICLSQLNRGPESRENNRPRMSDLRESGSIEQDADVVLLLHREEYYHVNDPEWADLNPEKVGVAEVIVAKQRNGPTGIVELKWDPKITRFKNLAQGTSHHALPPQLQGAPSTGEAWTPTRDPFNSPNPFTSAPPGDAPTAPNPFGGGETRAAPPFDERAGDDDDDDAGSTPQSYDDDTGGAPF